MWPDRSGLRVDAQAAEVGARLTALRRDAGRLRQRAAHELRTPVALIGGGVILVSLFLLARRMVTRSAPAVPAACAADPAPPHREGRRLPAFLRAFAWATAGRTLAALWQQLRPPPGSAGPAPPAGASREPAELSPH